MVTLVIEDFEQISMLEYYLNAKGIAYKFGSNKEFPSVPTPYLLVDGVPLGFQQSINYIEEYKKNDR